VLQDKVVLELPDVGHANIVRFSRATVHASVSTHAQTWPPDADVTAAHQ
jgi:hypothetical protein